MSVAAGSPTVRRRLTSWGRGRISMHPELNRLSHVVRA